MKRGTGMVPRRRLSGRGMTAGGPSEFAVERDAVSVGDLDVDVAVERLGFGLHPDGVRRAALVVALIGRVVHDADVLKLVDAQVVGAPLQGLVAARPDEPGNRAHLLR